MNPQGMEEHRTRGLKRLALLRLRALSREAARLADRVVATDEATRADVTRLLGVAADKVVVLPNGIDPDAIAAGTPPEPRAFAEAAVPALRDAELVLLSVGRLEAYKGFGDVQEALARLQARAALPARWRWVVAGAGALPAADRVPRGARGGAGARAGGAAARAVRARRPVRARDALRGLEPRHAGGDGARRRRGRDARGRHPRQDHRRPDGTPGRAGRRAGAGGRDRGARCAIPRSGGAWARRRGDGCASSSPGPCWSTARSRSTRSCCADACA